MDCVITWESSRHGNDDQNGKMHPSQSGKHIIIIITYYHYVETDAEEVLANVCTLLLKFEFCY